MPEAGTPDRPFAWLSIGDPPRIDDADVKLSVDALGLPDTALDAFTFDGLDVRAACVRGWANRYYGRPRADNYALTSSVDGRLLVVAVADGVSAAAGGHVAAAFASRRAATLARDALVDPLTAVDWTAVFHEVAGGLTRVALQRGAPASGPPDPQTGSDTPTDDVASQYATTLTLLICPARPSAGGESVCVNVGDSPVWGLSGARLVCVAGHRPDADIATSAVDALPFVPAGGPAVTPLDAAAFDALFVMTDGIGDPLGSGESDLGRTFVDRLSSPPEPLEFAAIVGFRRKSFDDDRTMIAIWPRSLGP